jgi:mono/diheme cytochrome c family protein
MRCLGCVLVLCVAASPILSAQAARSGEESGEALYRAACAACHAPDGRGQPQSRVGFETPLPDFTDCGFSTPEPDADWSTIVHLGGPARAFDRRMPAFGDALSSNEIDRIIQYIRGFCTASGWPRGELNLPRALVTEKAFPENEALLTAGVAGGDSRAVALNLLYERRLGVRNQFEIVVPIEAQQTTGGWTRGLGDVAFAMKRVLAHSLRRGSIVSAGGEVTIPTGRESAGLGAGGPVFEPFVAFGQLLPSDSFFQVQSGLEFPSAGAQAEKEAFWRAALGRTFLSGSYGRAWSPMVEILGERELAAGEEMLVDVVPQMQVTISRRQHVMISAGVRLPVTERRAPGRDAALLTYVLWDWFDGGMFDGWR